MAESQKKSREAKRDYFDKNLRRPERESRTISQTIWPLSMIRS